MSNKPISEAEKVVNLSEVKRAIQDMKEYIPSIAEITMEMYKKFAEQGFNEEQAFNFAKECALKMLFR